MSVGPDGDWRDRCPPEAVSALVTVDMDPAVENPARPWRRVARSGLHDRYQAPAIR